MINLETRYGSAVAVGDADFPEGSFKNDAVAGDNSGTPFEAAWPNDIYGFFYALLEAGGTLSPDNNIETAQASQLLTALNTLIDQRANDIINARFVVGGTAGNRTLDIDTDGVA